MMGQIVEEMMTGMVALYAEMPERPIGSERIAFTFIAASDQGGPEPFIRLVNTDIPIELTCTLVGRVLAKQEIPLFGAIAVYYDQDRSAVKIEGVSTGQEGYEVGWPAKLVDGFPVLDRARKPPIRHVKADSLPLYSAWIEYTEAMDMGVILAKLLANIARMEARFRK